MSKRSLAKDGYACSIQGKGPFVPGKDFEAPAASFRRQSQFRLTPAVLTKLEECIQQKRRKVSRPPSNLERELFNDAISGLDLENGVSEALEWYVSDYQYQSNLPEFRKLIAKLQKRVEAFRSKLPTEDEALGKFIRDCYTGDAFIGGKLRPKRQQSAVLNDAWDDEIGFTALAENLDVMARCVSSAKICLGKEKTNTQRVRDFVNALAHVWLKSVGAWPTSGRDGHNKQSGPFARFVHLANGILPPRLRIRSLDAAIRSVCEQRIRIFR